LDVDSERAYNDGMDCGVTKRKNVGVERETRALEATKANLACFRRVLANMEAMAVRAKV
jgi:hypothetical protein